MKKPVVDYRKLRLHNWNSPEFSHLKLLLGWVGYFVLYALTERLIPAENCHVIHSALDDLIPFCAFFVLFYVLWYGLIAGSLLWFMLYSVESFCNLQIYFIVTQALAMAVYLLYPSRQDLRPEVFPRENILTGLLGMLYRIDTNTGVFPSFHVAGSVAIASVWLREKQAGCAVKIVMVILALLICLSVVFVKQHSVLDILGALPVCLAAEWFVFYRKQSTQEV